MLLPSSVLNQWKRQRMKQQYKEWQANGCPNPPPHLVKQKAIQQYQQSYGCTTFVETGTYLGDMVEAQKKSFEKVYSVELSVDLFKRAQDKFKKDENVTILQGDSGKVLPEIVKSIHEPTLFWLDGHYSAGTTAKGEKECPIFEELNAIFSRKEHNHIVLIDDARHFVGKGDYPTVAEITDYVKSQNEKYYVEVKHDIIRCII